MPSLPVQQLNGANTATIFRNMPLDAALSVGIAGMVQAPLNQPVTHAIPSSGTYLLEIPLN
jgi:hypothetical protein